MDPKPKNNLDRVVGLRITAHRKARQISQTALATAIGVSFQQVQNYERGINRVGAGRLQLIARTFGVPVSSLYGDERDEAVESLSETLDLLAPQGALSLLQAFAAIEDAQMRREVLDVVQSAGRIGMGPLQETARPSLTASKPGEDLT